MTDTTDQQAMTVALEKVFYMLDALAGERMAKRCPDGRKINAEECVFDLCSAFYMEPADDWHGDLAARLASVSSASAEGEHGVERVAQAIYEAGGSFADQNGPIAWSDLEGSNDAENFRKMACAALAAMPTRIVAQDLREILERIRDVPDNLLPSATIQRMRNIAGFGLIGESIS